MSLTRTCRSQPRSSQPLQITANGLAKRVKRAAFGLRNFVLWRIRVLLYAGKPDWSKLPTVTP